MSMTTAGPTITGGPSLPQERRLVTAIPGPKSQELIERKNAAVSASVGTMMPVYAVAAGGGVIVDVDGNSLIDLGSGIAVYWAEFTAAELAEAAVRAGFTVDRLADRAPYEQEIASQRLYLEASLPGKSGLDASRNAP